MKPVFLALTLAAVVLTVPGCRSGKKDASDRAMENRERIIEILRATGRPGIEAVISNLDTTDFYTRGAGGHHTEVGGLAQHSLEVYRIMQVTSWFLRSDSVAITALMHDMGKIDYGGWHPWRSVKHLSEWGLKLTKQEYFTIFYHHKPKLRYFRYPLRVSLSFADVLSSAWWRLWHRAPSDASPDDTGAAGGPDPHHD